MHLRKSAHSILQPFIPDLQQSRQRSPLLHLDPPCLAALQDTRQLRPPQHPLHDSSRPHQPRKPRRLQRGPLPRHSSAHGNLRPLHQLRDAQTNPQTVTPASSMVARQIRSPDQLSGRDIRFLVVLLGSLADEEQRELGDVQLGHRAILWPYELFVGVVPRGSEEDLSWASVEGAALDERVVGLGHLSSLCVEYRLLRYTLLVSTIYRTRLYFIFLAKSGQV